MKKFLAILPAATLALTGCLSSTEEENETPAPTPKILPTDYIVSEMGEYSYGADGSLEITKATCTDRANEYVWTKVTQQGSLTDTQNNTAQIDLGDGAGKNAYDFKPLAGETFPNGSFYKTSSLGNALIEGVMLEDPYYSDVIFVNTQCLFQNFGEMQETLALMAKVPKSSITMECNKLSIQGLEMTYVSHTETGMNYTLSYGGKSCTVKHEFRYAYNKDDCAKAFSDYQQDYANGETQDFFDFNLYDQNIVVANECVDIFTSFHNETGLAKSASAPTIDEKQFKAILRAVGSRLRKGK